VYGASLSENMGLVVCQGYHGGSPSAVQAWQPCPLSPSHPILVWIRDLLCVICVVSFYCVLCIIVCVCVYFVLFPLFDFSFVALSFSTLILLVGSFDL